MRLVLKANSLDMVNFSEFAFLAESWLSRALSNSFTLENAPLEELT